MDKKLYPNLDPKLKEVYDRVMGFNQPPTPPTPAKNPASVPAPSYQPISISPKKSDPIPFIANVNVGVASKNKSSSSSMLLLIIVGLIFFIVYGLFWVKFFNIQLPFSLPFLSQ